MPQWSRTRVCMTRRTVVQGGYGTRDGYSGWAGGGLYRVPTDAVRGEAADSEAGPGSPTEAGVGGQQARTRPALGTTTPCGRARFAVPRTSPRALGAGYPPPGQ